MQFIENILVVKMLTGLMAAGSLFVLYKKIQSMMEYLSDLRVTIDKEGTYKKVPGLVTDLGMNVDYDYPEKIPSIEGIQSDEEFKEVKKSFLEDLAGYQESKRYMGVYFAYKYKVNGKVYSSRNIGEIPSRSDSSFVYKYKKGDKITVYVDPKSPERSVIRQTDDSIYASHMWATLWGINKEVIMFTLSSIIFTAVVF